MARLARLSGVALLSALAWPALAQDLGTSMPAGEIDIHSVEIGENGNGTAILGDGLNERYLCDVTEKRSYAEIGGCKPLRVSKRVGEYMAAQTKVLDLFERNECSLTYDQLKSALSRASEETRRAVGEIMADMTNSGALVDDEARGRARLTAGATCGG